MVSPAGCRLSSMVPFARRSPLKMFAKADPVSHNQKILVKKRLLLPASPPSLPSTVLHAHRVAPPRDVLNSFVGCQAIRSFGSKSAQNKPLMPLEIKKFTGLAAEFFDVLHGPISNAEIEFYDQLVKDRDKKVLIVGCGTGRLLLSLLQRGIKADGIDPSLDMIEICNKKIIRNKREARLYPFSMENFQLQTKYGHIFVPGETFMLILNRADALAALKNAWSHLETGGQMVIELTIPSEDALKHLPIDGSISSVERDVICEENKVRVTCQRKQQRNAIRQWIREIQKIEVFRLGDKETQVDISKMRWYTIKDIFQILKDAGFVDIEVLHSASQQNDELKMIFQAKKPMSLF